MCYRIMNVSFIGLIYEYYYIYMQGTWTILLSVEGYREEICIL